MKTLDLKKEFKHLYQPSAKKIEIVQVPKLQFAMIDGSIEKGSEPGKSPMFAEATQALYSLSYTLKFMFKKRKTNPIDYPVMALEGLWWVEDGFFDITVKDNWFYTLMILQPDIVTKDIFEEAREQVRKKKGDSEMLNKARLAHFEEGLCVQTMHIGPYATEPATIDHMKEFMAENGLKDSVGPIGGKHHEIYMSDPRKAAPEKMKTVLRHPVVKA
ncbi:MAG: GyrI-like domain-containing protein [Anaerolineales bacterium]|nr:GyrI-like domain-containing protein [Anaerolineales bacterium]WKZ41809.1 MAG: GyrI-like domain-containing protein [Anaerolineales bacterium]